MKFVSIDSSLANTGVAVGEILDNVIVVREICLLETKKTKNKQVRSSSDTIQRCKDTYKFVHEILRQIQPQVVFAETPSGSQSAAGMKSYGATCQLIASVVPPAIEVTPEEVKLASVGSKTASKADMIKWAFEQYADVQWDCHPDGTLKNKNEHMADAIAIVYAGVKTDEFNRIKNFLR